MLRQFLKQMTIILVPTLFQTLYSFFFRFKVILSVTEDKLSDVKVHVFFSASKGTPWFSRTLYTWDPNILNADWFSIFRINLKTTHGRFQ